MSDRTRLFSKIWFGQKWPNTVKTYSKIGFDDFFCRIVYLDLAEVGLLVLDKSTNGAVIFCKNCISEKIFVPRLYAKMLSSSQVAGFSHHQYLWKESFWKEEGVFAWWYSPKNGSILYSYFWFGVVRFTQSHPNLSSLASIVFGWSGTDEK